MPFKGTVSFSHWPVLLSMVLAAPFPVYLYGCAVSPVHDLKTSSVAVWDMENLTPGQDIQPADMGEFLSANVIDALQQNGIHVVEREKLVRVLEELNLGSSELADQDTRLRLGRILNARFMIFGGYQCIAGQVRFDLRLVDVETSMVLRTSEKTVSSKAVRDWTRAVREAALRLFSSEPAKEF